MASKPKTPTTLPASKAAAPAAPADAARAKAADDLNTAKVMTNGQCNAAVVKLYLSRINGSGSNVQALCEASQEQALAIGKGDLSSLEFMLLAQAQALQAMFIDLASVAKRQERTDNIQTMTTLALKCAAQSRQAVTALAELRVPKTVMFAKQANVTSGPQQVNNGVNAPLLPPRVEEIQNRPNELLEAQHGNGLVTRTAGTAGRADPHLATVGEVHRAEVAGR